MSEFEQSYLLNIFVTLLRKCLNLIKLVINHKHSNNCIVKLTYWYDHVPLMFFSYIICFYLFIIYIL